MVAQIYVIVKSKTQIQKIIKFFNVYAFLIKSKNVTFTISSYYPSLRILHFYLINLLYHISKIKEGIPGK